jgi:hypothetical protein
MGLQNLFFCRNQACMDVHGALRQAKPHGENNPMSVVNHMPDYVFGNCKVANPLAGTELHRGILPVALLRSSRGTLWRKSYQHASCDTPISNIASTSSAGGRGNVSVHPRWDRAGGRVKSQRLLTRDLRARGNAFFFAPSSAVRTPPRPWLAQQCAARGRGLVAVGAARSCFFLRPVWMVGLAAGGGGHSANN